MNAIKTRKCATTIDLQEFQARAGGGTYTYGIRKLQLDETMDISITSKVAS